MVKMESGEGVETEAIGSKGKRGSTDTPIERMEGRKVLIGRLKKERFLPLLKVIPVIETLMKGGPTAGREITRAGTRT